MIQWETTGAGVAAVDAAGNEVTVRARDWREARGGRALARPADAAVSGVATRLSVPASEATVSAS
ncbi:hypothetical protein, partial [Halobacterium sp. CBA1126]